LYSVDPKGSDHDAVMRIGGEASKRGPILTNGVVFQGVLRVRRLGSSRPDVGRGKLSCWIGEGAGATAQAAEDMTTPAGIVPVVR
jgi:hypothetical protein